VEGSNPSLEWDELELKISQVCFSMHVYMGGWVWICTEGYVGDVGHVAIVCSSLCM
jgi:hypothetical protein